MVQLREKNLPGRALLDLACRIGAIVKPNAALVINERVDVALAYGADGVQLAEEGLPISAVRQLVGPGVLIGRSVHSAEGAAQAEAEGADFLIAGTIFSTGTHPEAQAAGVGLLAQIASRVEIPFLGIGGITCRNVTQVMEAGASGAAVISAITAAQHPEQAALDLKRQMELAWHGSGVAIRRPNRA